MELTGGRNSRSHSRQCRFPRRNRNIPTLHPCLLFSEDVPEIRLRLELGSEAEFELMQIVV